MIYILFAYLAYLIVFGVFSYFALYHIWRFGFVGDLTKMVIYGYVILSLAIIITSLFLIIVI